ncbi:TPA: hypothetical protein ACFNMZ_000001, partial [Neisseria polysaccharea]
MPSEALSDGIFYCLCRFVSGRKCLAARHCCAAIWVFRRHRGLRRASDGIAPSAVIPTSNCRATSVFKDYKNPSFPRRRESRP